MSKLRITKKSLKTWYKFFIETETEQRPDKLMNTRIPRHVALGGMGGIPQGVAISNHFPIRSSQLIQSALFGCGKKRSKAVSETEKKTEKWWTLIFSTAVCGVLMEECGWNPHTANKRLETQLVSVGRRLSKWSFTFAIECCGARGVPFVVFVK